MFYNIIQGLKNLWYWFPVIWKDKDWDSIYIFIILKKKLERQRICLSESFPCKPDLKKDVKKIRICEILIERILEDTYYENITEVVEDDSMFGMRFVVNSLGWTNKTWTQYSELMIKQDLKLLFKILERNIRCWWD